RGKQQQGCETKEIHAGSRKAHADTIAPPTRIRPATSCRPPASGIAGLLLLLPGGRRESRRPECNREVRLAPQVEGKGKIPRRGLWLEREGAGGVALRGESCDAARLCFIGIDRKARVI